MNDILAVYLKAYTSKKAADSVADDVAVGTGSGLLGWVAGRAGGKLRGERLRDIKAPKIERALNRIRSKRNNLEPKVRNLNKNVSQIFNILNKASYDEIGNTGLEPILEKDLGSLRKLEPLLNKYNKRYYKTWDKASKLQKAIKNSRRVGGVAGAVGAGLLSTLLYNKLQKD
jgi:uncharacterized protein YlxW (UPF0749 family)